MATFISFITLMLVVIILVKVNKLAPGSNDEALKEEIKEKLEGQIEQVKKIIP